MTITAQDVNNTLAARAGYPPLRPHDIDRIVRVLNAHRASTLTVSSPMEVDLSRGGQDKRPINKGTAA